MIVQQGQINTTALVVPGLIVQIVPPSWTLLNGVPTWTSTTTLSTIAGTLGVGNGGTASTKYQPKGSEEFRERTFSDTQGFTSRVKLGCPTPVWILPCRRPCECYQMP